MLQAEVEELLKACTIPIIIYNLDGVTVFINQAYTEITGYTNEDILDTNHIQISEEVLCNNNQPYILHNEGKTLKQKYRSIKKKNGETIIVSVEYSPLKDDKKKQIGTILMVTNIITCQYLSQINNEQIFEVIKIGIIGLNNKGEIIYMNHQAEAITGVTKEEARGRSYQGFFKFFEGDIGYTFERKENIINKRVLFSDGVKERAFLTNTLMIKNDMMDLLGVNLYFYEITEVNQSYQQLIDHERFRLISEMAAGTAHEIRNPLTSLKGFLQILENKIHGVKEKEYIDIMLEEIEQISYIIKEFMNLGKPKNCEYYKFQLSKLIMDLVKFVKSEALLREITININNLVENTNVYGDKEQIKQVFLNILQNGLHAIESKGFINISLDSHEDRIYVNIVDSGTGIPTENLTRIFDPFFTTKANGTGLGLALSKKIIHDHGGEIIVSSKLNEGTVFTVSLPLQKHKHPLP